MHGQLSQQWLPRPARAQDGVARLTDVEHLLSGCFEAVASVMEAADENGDPAYFMIPLSAELLQLLPLLHALQENTAWLQTPHAVQNLGWLPPYSIWQHCKA